MLLQLQSLLVYLLLGILMFFFAYKAEKTDNWLKPIYNLLPLLIFTAVIGLRYNVGVDWANYQYLYDEKFYLLTFSEMMDLRFETGFTLLVFFCKIFDAPVYVFFTVIAAIQILLIYRVYKEDKGVLPYIYLAFIISGVAVQGFCNLLRQDLAFCVFLIALKYASQRKTLWYILICILATCFHNSAFILLPLFLLWIKDSEFFSNTIIQLGILFICILFSFLDPIKYLLSYATNLVTMLGYMDYIEVVYELETNSVWGITRYLILIGNLVIILNSKRIKDYFNSELLNKSYDLYFIGICCYFLFLGNMMFGRITLYFTNFFFIIYGYTLYYYIKQQKTGRNIIRFGIIAIMLFISFSSMIYNCTRNTDAYVSYFQEELHPLKDNLRQNMFDQR